MVAVIHCSDFGAQENKIFHCFHLISRVRSLPAVTWEPKKIKSVTVSTFSLSICHEVMGPDATIFVFWMLNFKPAFSFSPFTFVKRHSSSSSLSAIRVISFAYLRLLIFLLALLIPSCDLSSLAFCLMYSAYKLNNQGNNIQPCHTAFPIFSQLSHVRFIASWPAYRFLRRQLRW